MPGDIYLMDEKATGNDWKNKSIETLRHATGGPSYIEGFQKKKH
jgi:hypothetical protein